MRINASRRITLGLAFGAILLAGNTAWSAPDAKQVADALVAASSATGRAQANYDSAEAEGDAIAIANFKLTRSNAQTIVIPKVIVTGAAPRQPGGFTAASISFDGGKATHGKDTVTWATGLIEEAVIPTAEEVKAESDIRPFAKLGLSEIAISESNLAEPVTVADIRVVLQSAADGTTGAFATQIGGVHFSVNVLKNRPQEKAVLDALGYENFDINIAAAGAFDAAAGTMTLNTMTINTADIGTVTVKAQVNGISPGKVITSNSESKTRSEAKLETLDIRFDNSGVVERALDMHAAMIWGTRADAAAQAKALVPLGLRLFGIDSEFEAKATKAVGDFIDEPKSITFSASPNPAVPFEKIIDSARDKPGSLPGLLGANISAN